jgi:hypothetical protein
MCVHHSYYLIVARTEVGLKLPRLVNIKVVFENDCCRRHLSSAGCMDRPRRAPRTLKPAVMGCLAALLAGPSRNTAARRRRRPRLYICLVFSHIVVSSKEWCGGLILAHDGVVGRDVL